MYVLALWCSSGRGERGVKIMRHTGDTRVAEQKVEKADVLFHTLSKRLQLDLVSHIASERNDHARGRVDAFHSSLKDLRAAAYDVDLLGAGIGKGTGDHEADACASTSDLGFEISYANFRLQNDRTTYQSHHSLHREQVCCVACHYELVDET